MNTTSDTYEKDINEAIEQKNSFLKKHPQLASFQKKIDEQVGQAKDLNERFKAMAYASTLYKGWIPEHSS